MRTDRVATETGDAIDLLVNSGFNYDPDRHYTLIQLDDREWTASQGMKVLNEVDGGERAYRIDADGRNDEGAAITGDKRLLMVSCTKKYAAKRLAVSEAASRAMVEGATPLDVENQNVDKMRRDTEGPNAQRIRLKELYQADLAARKERRELLAAAEA